MRTFALGDIHGNIRALKQVFERAPFQNGRDQLVFLGDVADGWPYTKQCVEFLLGIDHLIPLLGNHDRWTLDYFQTGLRPMVWTTQGGKATLESYSNGIPQEHIRFFERMRLFHEDGGRLFVHAGVRDGTPLVGQAESVLCWSRTLASRLRHAHEKGYSDKVHVRRRYIRSTYDEIFIGHTSTWGWSGEPVHHDGVWNLDQGAGYAGRLTMLDIESKEWWQSDEADELYDELHGR